MGPIVPLYITSTVYQRDIKNCLTMISQMYYFINTTIYHKQHNITQHNLLNCRYIFQCLCNFSQFCYSYEYYVIFLNGEEVCSVFGVLSS